MFPVEVVEQPVFGRLVVAGGARVHVARRAEVPAQRRDDRPFREAPGRAARARAGRGSRSGPPSINSPTKSARAISMPRFAARAGVGGAGSIRTLRSCPGNELEHRRVDGLGRAVVDDDHLVVVGRDAPLVVGRERAQGARELARHVVGDHDDADHGIRGARNGLRMPPSERHRDLRVGIVRRREEPRLDRVALVRHLGRRPRCGAGSCRRTGWRRPASKIGRRILASPASVRTRRSRRPTSRTTRPRCLGAPARARRPATMSSPGAVSPQRESVDPHVDGAYARPEERAVLMPVGAWCRGAPGAASTSSPPAPDAHRDIR